MDKLIEALQIFLKYGNPGYPTHCEHDILLIMDINPEDVSSEDTAKLDELGFFISTEYNCDGCFASFKYGSA